MTAFVQVIEWSTTRIEKVQALQEQWRERFPQMGPSRVTVCADRNHPGGYLTIVEFPSYEDAMRNSEDPATQEFASRMMELCDGPPVFHDLDVLNTEVRVGTEQAAATTTR